MKVSFKWLKEYLTNTPPAADVAQHLTMAGMEVKGMEIVGGTWDNVFVGQLVAVNPHPNADRLRLATVNLGTSEETVVCGAPNLTVGDKIAFAKVGARLIDGHTAEAAVLKSAKIRGVLSSGMVCSEKELGISDSHEGILVLRPDAPLGTPLADYLGDVIYNMEITPNRPDCLSIIGIAREASVLTRQSLRLPEVSYEETEPLLESQISVEIAASDLCPRYCATLITGVTLGPSPDWMQHRLLASGMRPINNVVDVTNYVMLEYGQPLHSFDFTRLRGQRIIVRRARPGETMFTLDGVSRNLSPDMLVIADAERPVAVAGVMGGANSEVFDSTTSILLEAASFNPASIHYTAHALNLQSEASMRFERGISAGLTLPALKRATQLIAQLGGGKVARGIVDVYPGKSPPEWITLPVSEVSRVLGTEFTLEHIVGVLTSLGFECRSGDSDAQIVVTAPYWRSDIRLSVDLIEELARIVGYDHIPMTMLGDPMPRQNPAPIIAFKRKMLTALAGFGFHEGVTFSLTSMDLLQKVMAEPPVVSHAEPPVVSNAEAHPPEPKPMRVSNPMTADQEYLRPNLRPNLLAAIAANRRHEEGGIRLFELGKVYLPRPDDLPDEREMLCGVLNGPRFEPSWDSDDKSFDFFDAKGLVESLLGKLGIEADFEPSSDVTLHPAKQVIISVKGNKVGVAGEVHPQVLQRFDLSQPTYLFEMDLAALLPFTIEKKLYQPIPRFPAIIRDMALVVDIGTTHRQIADIVQGFPLVVKTAVFDIYSGKQVAPDKKSLAYHITFQSPTHTLTDDEVDKVQQQILNKLSHDFGVTLRG